MRSALADFLTADLPRSLGAEWDSTTMSLARCETAHREFYVADNETAPLRPKPEHGAATFTTDRKNGRFEIIHFENCVDRLTPLNAKLPKCDCIVAHMDLPETFAFVEFTAYASGLLAQKRAYATETQLPNSIRLCYAAGNFLDGYTRRIALFAYTLNDAPAGMPPEHPMGKLKRTTRRNRKIAEIQYKGELEHGFKLFECCAPAKFPL